eukprot:13507569-Ditylum_brightwellii.AAC.1
MIADLLIGVAHLICKLDTKDMRNMTCQLYNHKEYNCPLDSPHNIKIKSTKEALTQHIAKYPPPIAKPDLDIKRKTPICLMLSRNPIVKKIACDLPNDDMDKDEFATSHEDEPTNKDNRDIKDKVDDHNSA